VRAAVVAHGLSQDRSSAPSRRTPAFALPRTEPATFDRPHPAPGGVDVAGLGLAISRAIVEAHGGRIWLADSPAGTRVRFSLPAAA